MNKMHHRNVYLKKGNYLAPKYQICDYDNLLIGLTEYSTPVETGVWHSHENPMLSFVLYGSNIEFRKGKVITRKTGSVNFYNSYETHKNIYKHFPSKHISVELDSQFLKHYGYKESQIELAIQHNNNAPITFINFMNELMHDDAQSSSTVEMLFLELMENSFALKDKHKSPAWIKSIDELLNDKWNENLSLADLAENCDVHPTTISKNFRKYFNYTYGDYTRRLKVSRSLGYLHSSKYSITEIAYLCGFSDHSHFTRVFKSLIGKRPKDILKV